MEVYSIQPSSARNKTSSHKKFLFSDPPHEDSKNYFKNREISNKIPSNVGSRNKNTNLNYLGTPEIMSRTIPKIKSPRNLPSGHLNPKEIVRSNLNLNSYRESTILKKMANRVTAKEKPTSKKSRNPKKDQNALTSKGKENKTADGFSKKRKVDDYLARMKSFHNFKLT